MLTIQTADGLSHLDKSAAKGKDKKMKQMLPNLSLIENKLELCQSAF